ncbi:hypothetical protein DJ028_17455 [Pseudomonas veronii]|uniref:hypothetical protein n=1 Tax=Pseudomonas veronii TaxID=76761 RepID=UPI000FE32A48|nr:hypothetical protein [Pseudomonas veronii]RWA26266.1 hypothetical protein DJ028_17455 [Pseudomonas veronii]
MKDKFAVDLGRIGRTWGRDLGWQEISERDCQFWANAHQVLNSYEYELNGGKYIVTADLYKVYEWYVWADKCGRYYDDPKGFSGVDTSFLNSEIDLVLEVEVEFFVNDAGVDVRPVNLKRFAEQYFYDVFFIANIALPGSCEFLNARFINLYHSGEDYHHEKMYLSSYNFELSHLDFIKGERFAPSVLAIEDVRSWYKELGLGVTQIGDSKAARAIFALLHVCKSEMDITSIIWMFHAFEAIYVTRYGESVTGMVSRMMVLLDLPVSQQKGLTKELRTLYEERSAFVHGGYRVHHPLNSEQLDPRLSDSRLDTYDLCQFGFNLVVLSFQKLIEKGWFGMAVVEQVEGLRQPESKI